jgi:hypothetical protein
MTLDYAAQVYPGHGEHLEFFTKLANFSLAAINFLYGGMRSVAVPRYANSTQRVAQQRILVKWFGMVVYASSSNDFLNGWVKPLAFSHGGSTTISVPLVAAQVDGLARCGMVDPMEHVPPEAHAILNDAAICFPHGVQEAPQRVNASCAARHEYSALVRAQLLSGKVALMRMPTCSVRTFVVAKSGTDRLREVWDGGAISAASIEPFAPPLLADPAALTVLEASSDEPLFLSTRDGACFFDQLCLDKHLASYFGRPQLQVSELLNDDFSLLNVATCLLDGGDGDVLLTEWLTPVSTTWPMGFAHSSYLAQTVMTSACM